MLSGQKRAIPNPQWVTSFLYCSPEFQKYAAVNKDPRVVFQVRCISEHTVEKSRACLTEWHSPVHSVSMKHKVTTKKPDMCLLHSFENYRSESQSKEIEYMSLAYLRWRGRVHCPCIATSVSVRAEQFRLSECVFHPTRSEYGCRMNWIIYWSENRRKLGLKMLIDDSWSQKDGQCRHKRASRYSEEAKLNSRPAIVPALVVTKDKLCRE